MTLGLPGGVGRHALPPPGPYHIIKALRSRRLAHRTHLDEITPPITTELREKSTVTKGNKALIYPRTFKTQNLLGHIAVLEELDHSHTDHTDLTLPTCEPPITGP